jgi:hypothetical protein
MGEARDSAMLRDGGGQLRGSRPGKGKNLTSSRQRSRDAQDAKDPSYVRVKVSYINPCQEQIFGSELRADMTERDLRSEDLSYIDPGRARCRSGQGALRYQFVVVTHIHM